MSRFKTLAPALVLAAIGCWWDEFLMTWEEIGDQVGQRGGWVELRSSCGALDAAFDAGSVWDKIT